MNIFCAEVKQPTCWEFDILVIRCDIVLLVMMMMIAVMCRGV